MIIFVILNRVNYVYEHPFHISYLELTYICVFFSKAFQCFIMLLILHQTQNFKKFKIVLKNEISINIVWAQTLMEDN